MSQEWIVVGIVSAAALFLTRAGWRTLFGGGKGCGSSCGGCAKHGAALESTPANRIALKQV